MKRIDTATRAVNLFGTGKDGFKNGDLSAGDPPTDLNAGWFNGAQEELMTVIEGAGLAPSGGDLTQLWQALQVLTGGAGRVLSFARATAPSGWLKCNGAAVSRTTYAALFAAIGTTYGAGDGSTTFNLPELRGEFVRGLDDGRGLDTGRTLGSVQTSQNLQHTHAVTDPLHGHGATVTDPTHQHLWGHNNQNGSGAGAGNYGGVGGGYAEPTSAAATGISVSVGAAATGITIQNAGGTEARPRNVALLYCISVF